MTWTYWEYGVIIDDETSPHNGMLLREFRNLPSAEAYLLYVKEKCVIKRRQVVKAEWGPLAPGEIE